MYILLVFVLSVNEFSGLWCKRFCEILMLSCINKGHCYYMVTDYKYRRRIYIYVLCERVMVWITYIRFKHPTSQYKTCTVQSMYCAVMEQQRIQNIATTESILVISFKANDMLRDIFYKNIKSYIVHTIGKMTYQWEIM